MEVIYNLFGDLLPDGVFISLRMTLLILMICIVLLSFFFIIKNKLNILKDDMSLLDTFLQDLKIDLPNNIHTVLNIELTNMKEIISENKNKLDKIDERHLNGKEACMRSVVELKAISDKTERVFHQLEERIIKLEEHKIVTKIKMSEIHTEVKRVKDDR